MIHALKISTEYFDAVRSGVKPFEVRLNDRPFNVGDTLLLQEYGKDALRRWESGYTGREIEKEITYILDNEYCLPGYVILGLKSVEG